MSKPEVKVQRKLFLKCPCGELLSAVDDDSLVAVAQKHLQERHPEMAGKYTADDILALSY